MRRILLITASAVALTVGAGLGAAQAAQSQQSQQNSDQNAGATTASTQNDVMQAQQALQQQGLYHGKVDGLDGPQTHQAVRQFQQKNGLQVTGSLDQQTMDKLNGGAGATTSSGSSGAGASAGTVGTGARHPGASPQAGGTATGAPTGGNTSTH